MDRIWGMCGVCTPDLRQVMVVTSEQETTIKKGQALGFVSSVLELPDEDQPLLHEDLTNDGIIKGSNSLKNGQN